MGKMTGLSVTALISRPTMSETSPAVAGGAVDLRGHGVAGVGVLDLFLLGASMRGASAKAMFSASVICPACPRTR